MDNPKIDKVNTQIANTKARISEYQAKLRALERQKTDIENDQLITLIRSEKISDAELSALMQSLRHKSSAGPADAPAPEQEKTSQEELSDAKTEN